ncbi:sugar ABC transporter permease [Peribacillus psychrosaccharolyticus]|uniref:Xylose transport system permease protein XylH n=1 Tax=Peribacillus psychrosaccharolyticus TaxID=1407 RepID=A0A974NNR5_PERPY|nr:multiple monosaccharide ABC transporter permease [Peribacillus psychrosaccharolyticus]MEC2057299.1 sugar ABC transporter permease [Peribacillus psychrosaccharolyticus]MED3742874.1 sugar ABC transporter permease [Peribacillus psychrosaccharolyticus]QQT01057.1 sugar ABC transporter permease [Peribacillus psychrosaccharolyticus]
MKTLASLFKNNLRQYGMVLALVLIMILFQILTEGVLLKPINITNLILQNSYILVLAIGMLLVIILGHIDLSVGSVVAFVGAMSAIFMVEMNLPVWLSVVLCLIIGALIGAWQGFWVAFLRVPAFIVTLAGMLVFRGLTMLVLDGQSIAPFPASFRQMSSGFIPGLNKSGDLDLLTMIVGIVISLILIWGEVRKRKQQASYNFDILPMWLFALKLIFIVGVMNVFAYFLASYEGIPNILVILVVLIVVYSFITNRTIAGRHLYALGGNEKAAKLSGIKTKWLTFWVFVNMGVLAALSGLLFAARLNAATPKAGNSFELDAIAAVFIGGASAYGGIGTVIGAVVGGLVMGVLNNGMSLIGLGVDYQQTIKGLVLLIAVGFDVYNKNKSS